jgi:hypothetical protein
MINMARGVDVQAASSLNGSHTHASAESEYRSLHARHAVVKLTDESLGRTISAQRP